ncbi:MAG: 30S ribosomal protein S13 [bacterium]|nr:30S ribosomal protein S13 [bacterium]
MARIAGVNLNPLKNMQIALTGIYGIGRQKALVLLKDANVDPQKKAKDLTSEEENKLRNVLSKQYKVEGDLRREIQLHIRRLKDIGSFRGSRHAKHLPARGQRTRRNSRTVRGNVRITMGSGRKPSAEKT